MNFVDLVAILSVVQLLVFGLLVSRARGKYGVRAPATTGHEAFERTYRVQMNTIELMMAFLPSLYLAGKYWSPTYAAIAGAVYLVGRVLYAQAYIQAAERRGLGFTLSFLPIVVLVVAALVGMTMGGR